MTVESDAGSIPETTKVSLNLHYGDFLIAVARVSRNDIIGTIPSPCLCSSKYVIKMGLDKYLITV